MVIDMHSADSHAWLFVRCCSGFHAFCPSVGSFAVSRVVGRAAVVWGVGSRQPVAKILASTVLLCGLLQLCCVALALGGDHLCTEVMS